MRKSKEQIIESIAKDIVRKIKVLNETKGRIYEVKYFHPSGKSLPNGSVYQRGGFLAECRKNKDSFILSEGVHSEQYGMSKYRGGVIVFAVTVNAVKLSNNKVINSIKQFIETWKQRFGKDRIIHQTVNQFNSNDKNNNGEYIGAYSVGNFFNGKYIGDNGEMFNDKSVCIEINGLSSKSLLKLAEAIANNFRQETVLVKDLNRNKIYLADGIPNDDSFEEGLKKINTECQ